jgi:hypothetical protein
MPIIFRNKLPAICQAAIEQLWHHIKSLPWTTLRFVVWVLVLFGSVVAAIIGGTFWHPKTFWAAWESSGLSFTIIYTLAMWKIWFYGTPSRGQQPVNKILKSEASGTFFSCQMMMLIALVAACYFAWNLYHPICHVVPLVIASSASLVAQRQIRDKPEDEMKGHAMYSELHDDAAFTIKYSEIPTLISFSILGIFVVISSFSTASEKEIEAFVGGSVAFQLLLSNIIFGVNYAFRSQR